MIKLKDAESVRVAANFQRLRKQKGWTQWDTAQRSDPPVSFQYINHIENCYRGLGKRARKKWAEIFGVGVEEFLAPIETNDTDHELARLKEEAKKYGAAKIKRLRQLMPLLLGEYQYAASKKKPHKNHP